MFSIIISNMGFWINLLIPFTVLLFLVITNKEYILKEFGIQVSATLAYLFIIYGILFSTTTDLIDREYWNSKVKCFTKFERWTERETYTESYPCGKNTCTRTKTRYITHPEYYEVRSTLNETSQISRSEYYNAKNDFGDKFVTIYRSDRSSHGDGNKYVSVPNIDIPFSSSHLYENYVKAVKSNVIHTRVPKENIDLLVKNKKLVEYPGLKEDKYGTPYLDRVINTTNYKFEGLKELNLASIDIGKFKQANPIIYITDEGRSFKDALSQYWDKGKKNDIILILGIKDNKISWSDVITYTNNTDFIVDIQNNFSGLELNKEVINKFKNIILSSYIRKPMKEFEYLKENIELQWYYQLLIVIGNLLLSLYITYRFLRN